MRHVASYDRYETFSHWPTDLGARGVEQWRLSTTTEACANCFELASTKRHRHSPRLKRPVPPPCTLAHLRLSDIKSKSIDEQDALFGALGGLDLNGGGPGAASAAASQQAGALRGLGDANRAAAAAAAAYAAASAASPPAPLPVSLPPGMGAPGMGLPMPPVPGDVPLAGNLSRTLFVRNIDSSVMDEELYNLFEVRSAIVVRPEQAVVRRTRICKSACLRLLQHLSSSSA